jgi:two-component system response regulator VicR
MNSEKFNKIIYIEDDQDMIDLVSLILNRRGFSVIGADGGVKGLDMVVSELPDLVLLDLMMPDLDGWDVYQQMKSHTNTKNIPVIVITAKAQAIDKVLGLRIAKVDDYICKPFSPNELLTSIDRIFKKNSIQA